MFGKLKFESSQALNPTALESLTGVQMGGWQEKGMWLLCRTAVKWASRGRADHKATRGQWVRLADDGAIRRRQPVAGWSVHRVGGVWIAWKGMPQPLLALTERRIRPVARARCRGQEAEFPCHPFITRVARATWPITISIDNGRGFLFLHSLRKQQQSQIGDNWDSNSSVPCLFLIMEH